jgi:hypothetical protein
MPSPSAEGPIALDPTWITAMSATILALAAGLVIIVFVVWKPQETWLRALVYVLTIGIVALAISLTFFEKRGSQAASTDLATCHATIDTLDSYIESKLKLVEDAEAAKVLAEQMSEVVKASRCKPSTAAR